MIHALGRFARVLMIVLLLLAPSPVNAQTSGPILVAERYTAITSSPDGSRTLYSVQDGLSTIYQRPIGSISSTVVAQFPAGQYGGIIEFVHLSATKRLFYIEYIGSIERRLVTMLPDGSGKVVLDTTDDLNAFSRFDLSPDGRWLVYARGNELRVVSTEGGQPRTLVSTGEKFLGGYARITSDSTYVYAFVSPTNETGALYRYRLDTPEIVLIESGAFIVSMLEFPVLSSERIIYSADTNQGERTVEYHVSTGQKRIINTAFFSTLTADRQTLVYREKATGYIMAQEVAGNAPPRTLIDRNVGYRAVSATHVVFAEPTEEDQRYRISSVPIAGGPIRSIGVATEDEQSPPFILSPDGNYVVYRDAGLVSAKLADGEKPVIITPAPERAHLELASTTILPSGYLIYVENFFEGEQDRIQLARLDRLDVQQLNTSLFLYASSQPSYEKGYHVTRDGRTLFFPGKLVPEPVPHSLYQTQLPAPPQQIRTTYLPFLSR